ncbi:MULTISPECIES: hypothetical protein [unclassified Imperialibacter]|uniref:hypothetical protein n=1 Tax=unclassified Imperialibacter TaxID=2629706 RepID=UPI001253B6BD|nr:MULTISPECIES: hypothetical protein [unclassified Imperialibacter]CAD5285040.1 hypothetical protein IMPERIA75_590027 [Imperialibacter sp. 75]CAD5296793.1 hypothetical protein IMPERIA89_690027 [Imperialibacter sp. 89]VVT24127.1 hypothetical protein IMPR6_390028 [Imperialibacter sp. EC-SDR9]
MNSLTSQVESITDKVAIDLAYLEEQRLEIMQRYNYRVYKRAMAALGILCVSTIVLLVSFPALPKVFIAVIPLTGLFAMSYPIYISYHRHNKFKKLQLLLKTGIYEAFGEARGFHTRTEPLSPDFFEETYLSRERRYMKVETELQLEGTANERPITIAETKVTGASTTTRSQSNSNKGVIQFHGPVGTLVLKQSCFPQPVVIGSKEKVAGSVLIDRAVDGLLGATLSKKLDELFSSEKELSRNETQKKFHDLFYVVPNENKLVEQFLDDSIMNVMVESKSLMTSLDVSVVGPNIHVAAYPAIGLALQYNEPIMNKEEIRQHVLNLVLVEKILLYIGGKLAS